LPGAEKKGGGSSGGRLRRIVGDVLSAMTSKGRSKKSQEEYEKWSEEQWEAEALDAKGSYDAFVEQKRKRDKAQRDRVDAARYALPRACFAVVIDAFISFTSRCMRASDICVEEELAGWILNFVWAMFAGPRPTRSKVSFDVLAGRAAGTWVLSVR